MLPFHNFTSKAREAIRKAHEFVIERGQNQVSPTHLLASLLFQEENLVVPMIEKLGVDTNLLVDYLMNTIEAPEGGTVLTPSYQIYLTQDLVRADTSTSSKSPQSCPSVSLSALNLSRSMNNTAP